MARNQQSVRLFGATPHGGGSTLDLVLDSNTGRFRTPIFDDTVRRRILETFLRVFIPKRQFEMFWPSGGPLVWWNLFPMQQDGVTGVASLDSGVLLDHPFLYKSVIASEDYTGEGNQDDVGHGTITAILSVMASAFLVRLVNVKVVGRSGRGNPEHLEAALATLPDLAKDISRLGEPLDQAHVRCGIYTSRFGGLRGCDGKCRVCRAATAAAAAGIRIIASVGNRRCGVACPATAAVKLHVPGIEVIYDIATVR